MVDIPQESFSTPEQLEDLDEQSSDNYAKKALSLFKERGSLDDSSDRAGEIDKLLLDIASIMKSKLSDLFSPKQIQSIESEDATNDLRLKIIDILNTSLG